jgi:hypothetical protein
LGKVLKTVLVVAAVVALVVIAQPHLAAIVGSAFASAGVAAATAAVAGKIIAGIVIGLTAAVLQSVLMPKPKVSNSMAERLQARVDATAPRRIVFGRTAAGADVRFQEIFKQAVPTLGNKVKERVFRVIALASHRVHSVSSIYLEDELCWNGSNIGKYAQGLSFTAITEGSAGNAAAFGSGTGWTSSAKFTGCAYLKMVATLDPDIFPQSIPDRITTIVEGAPVYDPRLDGTRGGTGSMRTNNQSTWSYHSGGKDIGRNPALCLLTYLLGYRINGRIAWGMGIPPERIDFANFIAYANMCEENVSLLDGGTIQRYHCDGIFSTADAHETVISGVCGSMGTAKLVDTGGLYQCIGGFDDTDGPVVHLDESDLLGAYEWRPSPPARELFNIARGRFANPAQLYQLDDWGAVEVAPLADGIPRTNQLDFGAVSRPETAQRIAKQFILRNKYSGLFSGIFGPTAFALKVGSLVRLSVAAEGWNNKLFRVIDQSEAGHDLIFQISLQEESPEIYAWDREEKPIPDNVLENKFDPGATEPVVGLTATARSVATSGGGSVSYIDVSWTEAETDNIIGIQIDFKDADGSIWSPVTDRWDHKSLTFTHRAFASGVNTTVRARYVMATGVRGPYASTNVTATESYTGWDQIDGPGKPEDGATRNVNRGTWAGGVTYYAGDFVSHDGSTYMVHTTHTSNAGAPPPNANMSLLASQGGAGVPGPAGADGVTYYTWIAYADSSNGVTNFTTGEPGARTFIGIAANKTTATESTNPADYSWARFKGEDGAPGAPGLSGWLTNDAHVVQATNEGAVLSYAGADGAFRIMSGTTDVSSSFTLSTETNLQNLTVVYSNGLNPRVYTVTGAGALSGQFGHGSVSSASLTIRATGSGAFSGVNLYRTFTLTKARAGADATYTPDTTAPNQVTGLSITSAWALNTDGSQRVTMLVTWTASGASDLSHYVIAIKEQGYADTFYIEHYSGTNRFTLENAPANFPFTVRVRAVDTSGNAGAWSSAINHTTTRDTIAPALPTGLAAAAAFETIFLSWANPADADLSHVEIFEHTSNASGSATRIATVQAASSAQGRFTRTSLATGQTRWYWLKAVDTSGNASGFTAGVSATTSQVPAVDISGTIADTQIAGLAASKITGQLTDAQIAAIATAKLTGQITSTQISDLAISTPKLAAGAITTAKIDAGAVTADQIAANAIVAAKIDAGAITTAKIAAGAIQTLQLDALAVTADKLAANSVTANKILAGEVNTNHMVANSILGDRIQTNTLDAAKIQANTIISNTITVSGNNKPLSTAHSEAVWSSVSGAGKPADNATVNVVTYSATTPVSPANGDIWIDTSVTPNLVKVRVGGVWYIGGNYATQGSHVGVANGATKNTVSYGATTPSSPTAGDIWIRNDLNPVITRTYNGSAWVDASNYTINTNQLSDGAGLGTTATWSGVTGAGKPADNATVGAPNGTSVADTLAELVAARANDPANRINAHTTLIDPGKITISGSTTLANWRSGGDLTQINGGSIAANSVLTNRLSVGARGLDIAGMEFEPNRQVVGGSISLNSLAWTAGTITYINDSGTATGVAISAGFAGWSGGVSTLYVYWVKGASTLSSTSTIGTAYGADNVVIATYRGGTDMVVTYGRTIIDGSKITTNTIDANRIMAGTVLASNIVVGSTTLAGLGETAVYSNIVGAPQAARIVSNLWDTTVLKTGVAIPFGSGRLTSNGTSTQNSLVSMVGPSGASETVWRMQADNTAAGGGWDYVFNATDGYDHTKSYLYSVYVRWPAGSPNIGGQAYFGCSGNTTNDLGGGANANPYFVFPSKIAPLQPDTWYLLVGVLHGSGYTGGQSNLSGLYDLNTGLRLLAGTDYRSAVGATNQIHRAYQFYSSVGAVQFYARPRVEELTDAISVDHLTRKLNSISPHAGSSLTLVGDPTVAITGNNVRGTSGTWGWVYSREVLVGAAYMSFRSDPSKNYVIVGLRSSIPTSGGDGATGYTFYLQNGAVYIYGYGSNFGLGVSYTIDDVLTVVNDNLTARFYKNGTLLFSYAVPSNLPNYVSVSPLTNGEIYDIQFGAYMDSALSTADPAARINNHTTTVSGGKITTGSIEANKLSVTQLSAISANVGLLRTATSGARTEIEANQLRVYDASNILRVRIGVW